MFTRIIQSFTGSRNSRASQNTTGAQVHNQQDCLQNDLDKQNSVEIDRAFTCLVLDMDLPVDEIMTAENRTLLSKIKTDILNDDNPENVLPRMPSIIPRAIHAMHSKDVNVESLAQLLSSDIVITGEIIKLSNSAYYARGRELKSLEEAIVSIGFEGMRQMLISVIMKPILGNNKNDFTESGSISLWDTSMRTALMSSKAASLLKINQFHAYIISMLSQAGIAILVQQLHCSSGGSHCPATKQFIDELTHYANKVTMHVGRNWDLPEEITRAQNEILSRKKPHTMSTLAQIAYYSDKIIKIKILNANNRGETDSDYILPDIAGEVGDIYSQLGVI